MKPRVRSNLGDILEKRGIKRIWVAEQIGASKQQVTNWCKNANDEAYSTPYIGYILKLEALLGVPAAEMFELIEDDN